MNKLLNMCINFGFASFQGGSDDEEVYEKVSGLLHEFIGNAQSFNDAAYGFSGKEIKCNIFTGDLFKTDAMQKLCRDNNYSFNVVTSVYEPSRDTVDADAVIALDVKKHNLSYPNILAEYVVNKSDAVFLLWDGKQDFQDGVLWTVLQLCKQKRVPYYLINTEKIDEISFSSDSYYVPYSSEHVAEYVAKLYDYKEPEQESRPILLSKLWLALHNRFIRKYKLKAKNIPYIEDKILSRDFFPQDHTYYENHALLAEYFAYYDNKANDASSMYRASIYFRSILPMLTTIFIAVGFYAETVLTFLFGKPMLFGMNAWIILAGFGFLVHALMNFYAGQTSKNPQVKQLQQNFVEARFIAEYLRVVIHSEIYGIQIDNIRMDDTLVEPRVLAKVHHIIRQQEPLSQVQTVDVMEGAITNFDALIADQIVYHENCINRYGLITERLKKQAAVMYAAGISVVVLRGVFQFLIPFLSGKLQFRYHEVTIYRFLTSSANMLALVLPAWASYFSSKLNMNSYEWLLRNSEKARAHFGLVQKKLNETKLRKNNSYQIINDIANDIMAITREDYTGWYIHTESRSFTRL